MKALKISIAVSTIMLALPTLAAAAPNQQACFGQGRSAYAISSDPGMVGYWASLRAGDNASINAAYRDACQAL